MVRVESKPDESMFARLGIKANTQALFAEQTQQDTLVLPENWFAFRLFMDLQTQWRMGVWSPTGLDYQAVKAAFELLAIPRKKWTELFRDIQELESYFLEEVEIVRKEKGE